MSEMTENSAEYGLIVSFEDQSASYVHGFEAGGLSARMRDEVSSEDLEGFQITVHAANRVTIERMCAAYGWNAKFDGTDFPEWLYLTLTRAPKPTELPNPHGLRLVTPKETP